MSESGLEPSLVDPSGERARQNQNISGTRESAARREQDARDSLLRAQNALRRETGDNTTALQDNTSAVLTLASRLPAPAGPRGTDLKSPIPEGKR